MFETGCHCASLAGWKLTLLGQADLKLSSSSCLCVSSAGTTGVRHHAQLKCMYFKAAS